MDTKFNELSEMALYDVEGGIGFVASLVIGGIVGSSIVGGGYWLIHHFSK